MEEGLAGSRVMKSITSRALILGYLAWKASSSSEMPSMARQPRSVASADCGSRAVWTFTSSMRAVFSARSV